jgi:hypothetical protein
VGISTLHTGIAPLPAVAWAGRRAQHGPELVGRTLRKTKLSGIKDYFSHQGESELENVRLSEIFKGYLAKRTTGLWIISWMTFGAQVAITVIFPTVLVSQGFAIVVSSTR